MARHSLAAGTPLVARYKGNAYGATVLDGGRCRLEDGREFGSLSAAGSAITGGVACNGWRFWSLVEGGQRAAVAARVVDTPTPLKLVPAGTKATRLDANAKSDEAIAWRMQFHPPVPIHWCDGTTSTVPFDRLNDTLAQHNEEVHGRRRANAA